MHGAEVGSERTTVRERLKNEFHLGCDFLVAFHPIRSSMSCPSIGTCSTTVFDHHNTNNKCNNNSRIISHNCNHHFLIINARYFVTAIVKPVFSSVYVSLSLFGGPATSPEENINISFILSHTVVKPTGVQNPRSLGVHTNV